MKLLLRLAIPVVLLILLMVWGSRHLARPPVSAAVPEAGGAVSPPGPVSQSLLTEERWIVGQVGQYLADLGDLSRGARQTVKVELSREAKDGNYFIYRLKQGKRDGRVESRMGVWNPDSYADWGKDLFAKPVVQEPLLEDAIFAKKLLAPSLEVFLAENRRLSGFLQQYPASPRGHVQAALLVGVIALNEYAGTFRDTRPALNRMTAHLAAARLLGFSKDEPSARLAEALRLTLCGQQQDFLNMAKDWPRADQDPVYGEWQAILRLRNTLDWREQEAAAMAGSPAFRREYFRAVAQSLDAMVALKWTHEAGGEPDAVHCRIANETALSVEGGHVFTKSVVPLDLRDIAVMATEYGWTPVKDDFTWLREYLDIPDQSPVRAVEGEGLMVEVAGRDLWAGIQQRQLMQGLARQHFFLNKMLGLHDSGLKLYGFVRDTLPALRYKPFLLSRIALSSDPSSQDALNACGTIIRQTPESVPAGLWEGYDRDVASQSPFRTMPFFHSWFDPPVPAGTAYEAGIRIYDLEMGNQNEAFLLKQLWDRAPYDFLLCRHNAWVENGKSWEHFNPTVLIRWLGPLVDYHRRAITLMAESFQEEPLEYEKTMLKLAAFNPDAYNKMGEYFFKSKNMEKAAEYLLLAYEKAEDRVGTSASAPWLVQYLYVKGERDKAMEVATSMAEVYSHSGLESLLWFVEKEKNWDKSREIARQIDERYNNGKTIEENKLVLRIHPFDAQKAKEWGYDRVLGEVFPKGLKKVLSTQFVKAPMEGVLITGSSEKLAPFGLTKGMVIVALNGYRTDTFAQYDAVRNFSNDPKMVLVVWNGSSYIVSQGELLGRRFGVGMVDYVPGRN